MKERILSCIGLLLLISSSLCAMTAQVASESSQEALRNEGHAKVIELNEQLVGAAKVGDASLVEQLLNSGASFKWARNQFGLSSFEWAVLNGHSGCVNIFLDQLERETPPHNTDELQLVRIMRNLLVRFAQRDIRSLASLAEYIEEIHAYEQKLSESNSRTILPSLGKILSRLKEQFSLNYVLSCPDVQPALRSALLSAGSQPIDTAPLENLTTLKTTAPSLYRVLFQLEGPDDSDEVNGPEDIMHMHIDALVHVAVQQGSKELLRELIEAGAYVNNPDDSFRMPLHHVARTDRADMAKMLLNAGAMRDYEACGNSPFAIACLNNSSAVGQLLFEVGASIRPRMMYALMPHLFLDVPDRQPYFKMLLQGSKRRYMPTQKEAKRALQNVACLVDILGMRCNLPAYVIYEILLFATVEQHDAQGQEIAPEWTKSLKRDLVVIYLYKCNGNKLFPLWEQTVKCLIKDPQQQALLISKLENFMQPFLANEVVPLVSSSLMGKVAEESAQYKGEDMYGQNREQYREHLAQYLNIGALEDL